MMSQKKSGANNDLSVRTNHLNPTAIPALTECFKAIVPKKTIIVCVGTDKCIRDSLGPLVGTILSKRKTFKYPVYGTLSQPVHALTIERTLKKINSEHPNHFTIAIDAGLGYEDCIGDIQVKMGPVHPGKGVGKVLPQVGDISIVGVVDTINNVDVFSIRNTRLSFIMNMAEIISESLINLTRK